MTPAASPTLRGTQHGPCGRAPTTPALPPSIRPFAPPTHKLPPWRKQENEGKKPRSPYYRCIATQRTGPRIPVSSCPTAPMCRRLAGLPYRFCLLVDAAGHSHTVLPTHQTTSSLPGLKNSIPESRSLTSHVLAQPMQRLRYVSDAL